MRCRRRARCRSAPTTVSGTDTDGTDTRGVELHPARHGVALDHPELPRHDPGRRRLGIAHADRRRLRRGLQRHLRRVLPDRRRSRHHLRRPHVRRHPAGVIVRGRDLLRPGGGAAQSRVRWEAPAGPWGTRPTGPTPGMPAGYLGVGLDEYGNYSTTTYEGNDCHTSDPSWASFAPNEVTVHGPGNGTSGYCLLASSLQDSPDPLGSSGIQLHGADFASSEITVHVVIDTSDPNDPTYTVTPAARGRLLAPPRSPRARSRTSTTTPPPANRSRASRRSSPSRWRRRRVRGPTSTRSTTSRPRRKAAIPSPPWSCRPATTTAGRWRSGDSFNYVLTPRVDSSSAVSEDDPVTLVDHLPANQVLAGTPSGTGWDCSATSTTTNTADCTYTPTSPIAAGATLPPVSVPAATDVGEPGEHRHRHGVGVVDGLAQLRLGDRHRHPDGPEPPARRVDLGLRRRVGPAVVPGVHLTLGASVDSNGPAEASPPVVTSTLPSQLQLVSTPSGTDWDCSASVGQSVQLHLHGRRPAR